ncbi:hypothetical protein NEOC65_002483 [Neochlamydia sp. AcF65]|nr:hypothetical protein [Neochlamydia sp. AcF65]MBS4169633.1 hypothetical protein [Neochlamydia sp. AcF95]
MHDPYAFINPISSSWRFARKDFLPINANFIFFTHRFFPLLEI